MRGVAPAREPQHVNGVSELDVFRDEQTTEPRSTFPNASEFGARARTAIHRACAGERDGRTGDDAKRRDVRIVGTR